MWKALVNRTLRKHTHYQTWSQLKVQRKAFSAYKVLFQSWKQPENGFDTGLTIYNPLAKDKVPLISQHERILKWYACGPTVYDSAHIGHASAYVRQDVIRRIIEGVFGIDCIFVLGMTDIDDKIIARAHERNQTINEIASFYEDEFFSDMSKLNVLPPSMVLRVTEHLPEIMAFIQRLIDEGFAFKTPDGSVYFDVNKYGKYGVFSNPQQDGNEEEVSLTGKRSVKDFALWKATKAGEPKWDSPWGPGRPGWHIECSAMASSILGSNFDLHSGGEDLMFPHHENELAQSCAFHGTDQWVNYWLHTGKLYLSGQDVKMSKSLKNVISVSEFLDSYTSNQFRMLCLLSSYRKRVEFSDERMCKAVATVNTFNNFLNNCDAYINGKVTGGTIEEAELYQRLQDANNAVIKAYANDFNTPQALANMMRLLKVVSPFVGMAEGDEKANKVSQVRSPAVISAVSMFIKRHLDLMGMDLVQKKVETPSKLKSQYDDLIDLAVTSRNKVRSVAKDKSLFFEAAAELDIPREKAAILMKKTFKPLWNLSDEIRVQLLKRADVEVRDGKDESTWSIVETLKNKQIPNTKRKKMDKTGES